MNTIQAAYSPNLKRCDCETITNYFENSWQLEDMLLKSIVGEDTFLLNPDPLRNPLIFYLGHSAVFYINKLIRVGLLDKPLNPDYEILFEMGVDPQIPQELNTAIAQINWPELAEVWQYRNQVYQVVLKIIKNTPLNLPIHPHHCLWALMMAIEHQRIHFETSSMLIRQLPLDKVERPQGWQYAPFNIQNSPNEMREVFGGVIELGKPEDSPSYSWDSEYGYRQIEVLPFSASKYMISNAEFLQFVNAGGYNNKDYWNQEAWGWKTQYNIQHPKFWLPEPGGYKYRAMFDEIELPLDWPVEVNHYEAMAYCSWQGEGIRLMSEAEWNLATYGTAVKGKSDGEDNINNYNLNLKFGSPSPVGMLQEAKTASGLYDLRGNVWEWLGDNFNPLTGFKPHFLYTDNAAPFFDNQHKMMLGGAWVTNGTEALKYYRNWFRPYFYQHAGFRIARHL